jgi:nitrite reductase/ring-hydroxylating ferredoxin subunit
MPFVKVAQLSALPPGTLTEIDLGGELYALCNAGGTVSAIGGTCPHRGGPLGQGAMHGDNVVCPWHAWEWNCRTGANDFNPDHKVPVYAVQVNGDDILLEVPDRA